MPASLVFISINRRVTIYLMTDLRHNEQVPIPSVLNAVLNVDLN